MCEATPFEPRNDVGFNNYLDLDLDLDFNNYRAGSGSFGLLPAIFGLWRIPTKKELSELWSG